METKSRRKIIRKVPKVYRDEYGMKGNPILESLQNEFDKLSVLQERALKSNMCTDNYSVVSRQRKINILIKAIKEKGLVINK